MKGVWLGLVFLSASVIVSALAVVYAKHKTRTLFSEVQQLGIEQGNMDIEWGQIQLEESAWATHVRVESLARRNLEMVMPDPHALVIVRP